MNEPCRTCKNYDVRDAKEDIVGACRWAHNRNIPVWMSRERYGRAVMGSDRGCEAWEGKDEPKQR